jgi:hypothetical protein
MTRRQEVLLRDIEHTKSWIDAEHKKDLPCMEAIQDARADLHHMQHQLFLTGYTYEASHDPR